MSATTVLFNVKADTAQLVSGMNKAQATMTKSVDSMKKTVLGLATAYIGVQTAMKGFELAQKQATQMVNVAAQFEKFNTVLMTIEGSSEKAQKSMKWIEDFTKATPYQLEDVTSGFIKLRAYGLEPTEGLLRTLGDTSSAMGKNINQAVEAIADAVVGENERLKEFGVKASKQAEMITYNWVNASGEARTKTVANNQAIIESTLSAIFNSKYAGAMEAQSKTWNGMISNMQDNWTIFQKNIMDGGLFDFLKAMVTVVGEYMTTAFGNAQDGAKNYSLMVIDGLRATISGLGSAYDSIETFGDYFSVVGNLGKVAFYGLTTVFSYSAEYLVKAFEGAFNFVIDGINAIFETIRNASFGAIDFGIVGHVNWSGGYAEQSNASHQLLDEAKSDLAKSWADLLDTGDGAGFADKFLQDIDAAYEKIKNTQTAQVEKTDFGDAVAPDIKENEAIKDYVANIEVETSEITDSVFDSVYKVTDSLSNMNETLSNSNNNNDTYTIVNNVNDSLNDFNSTTNQTVEAIENVTQALDVFIFRFEDTFLNSIANNITSLESIYKTSSSSSNLSYADSLAVANSARSNLISNPLDITAGENYASAYNQLVSSADEYLSDMSNFNSKAEYSFASATVDGQISAFQDTAIQTVSVLDSMNNFLSTINQAFSDGILSDEEKATIAGVADSVNTKNETLLGSSGSVVAGLGLIPTAINSQTYYDNAGLATDVNMNAQEYFNNNSIVKSVEAQEYYNNSGLATDANINLQEYYNNSGLATNANMNAQTYFNNNGLALNTSLVGSNSVGSFVQSLMGGGTSGISLSRIQAGLPTLSVATGLDVSKLSNIATSTAQTNSSVSGVTGAVNNTNIKGGGVSNLGQLRLRSVTGTTAYFYANGNAATPSNYSTIRTTETYSYYAKGGFTGYGMGERDSTGQKQAGIVHEGEWVAPEWMVKNNPELFVSMENARKNRGFENYEMPTSASFSANNFTSSKNDSSSEIVMELKALKKELDEIKKTNEYIAIKSQEREDREKRAEQLARIA